MEVLERLCLRIQALIHACELSGCGSVRLRRVLDRGGHDVDLRHQRLLRGVDDGEPTMKQIDRRADLLERRLCGLRNCVCAEGLVGAVARDRDPGCRSRIRSANPAEEIGPESDTKLSHLYPLAAMIGSVRCGSPSLGGSEKRNKEGEDRHGTISFQFNDA